LETYRNETTCPKERCHLFCLEGEGASACHLSCAPRPCIELTAQHCPLDVCQVVDGCGGIERCFPKSENETPDCGNVAYSGREQCCPGLVKRCGIKFLDGTCDMKAEFSTEGVPICIPCGNGICNQFENICNCPEDCAAKQ
jgi:hypothetical protein